MQIELANCCLEGEVTGSNNYPLPRTAHMRLKYTIS